MLRTSGQCTRRSVCWRGDAALGEHDLLNLPQALGYRKVTCVLAPRTEVELLIDERALIARLHTLFGAHEKIPYEIRRADFGSTQFKAVNLAGALAALRNHDWMAELRYESSMASSGEDPSKPCICFRAGTGATLHICPRQGGTAACFFMAPYYLRKSPGETLGA